MGWRVSTRSEYWIFPDVTIRHIGTELIIHVHSSPIREIIQINAIQSLNE